MHNDFIYNFNKKQKRKEFVYWLILFAWCGGGVFATAIWWAYMWIFCK